MMSTKLDIMRERDGEETWNIVDGKVTQIKKPTAQKVIVDEVAEEIIIKEEVKKDDEKPKKRRRRKTR